MSINAQKDNFVKQFSKQTTSTQHVTYDLWSVHLLETSRQLESVLVLLFFLLFDLFIHSFVY